MPPRSTESSPRRRQSPGGGGWLLLFIIIAAGGTAVFFGGDKLRGLLGIAHRPTSDGSEPTAPGDVKSTVVARTPPESVTVSSVNTREPDKAVVTPDRPVSLPVAPTPYKDQKRGDTLLATAENDYRSFKWDGAKSAADQIITLDVKPATAARARDISNGSVLIANLFKNLDDRDEMARNYDTNPSLVTIGEGSDPIYAVPLSGGDAKNPQIVEQDPVGYITKMSQVQRVQALVKGKRDFIFTELPEVLTKITLVNQAQVRQEKQDEFATKLAALRNSAQARDALAWYEAAKFAYRNRLDDKVTEMLDQAMDLDPFLVKSVREDKAGRLYSAMILHMKNHSQPQADIYMSIIKRRYADTDQGKQAALYYAGQTQALLAMAAQEDQKSKEEAEARRQARIEHAKQNGDAEKVAAIQQEKTPEDAPAAAPNMPTDVDESSAQQAMDAGMVIYRKAIDMPATEERNHEYKKASDFFKSAVAQYRKLVEKNPTDTSLQEKMVEANKLKFGCEKYQTAF